jgi:hypothetical protein
MNSMQIMQAVGDIDDRYIVEAEPNQGLARAAVPTRNPARVRRLAPIAACAALLVAVLLASTYLNGIFGDDVVTDSPTGQSPGNGNPPTSQPPGSGSPSASATKTFESTDELIRFIGQNREFAGKLPTQNDRIILYLPAWLPRNYELYEISLGTAYPNTKYIYFHYRSPDWDASLENNHLRNEYVLCWDFADDGELRLDNELHAGGFPMTLIDESLGMYSSDTVYPETGDYVHSKNYFWVEDSFYFSGSAPPDLAAGFVANARSRNIMKKLVLEVTG